MSEDTKTSIIKNQWSMLLHCENFDICRVCMLIPESDQNIRFYHIFGSENDFEISEKLSEFLGLVIDENDKKPKLLCQTCYEKLREWVLLKKNAAESQKIINIIKEIRFPDTSSKKSATSSSVSLPETNQSSSNITDILTYSKNTKDTTNLNFSLTHSESKSSTLNNSSIESSIQHDFCSSSSTTQVNQHQSISINQWNKSTDDDQNSESDNNISSKRMKVATEAIRSPDRDFDVAAVTYESVNVGTEVIDTPNVDVTGERIMNESNSESADKFILEDNIKIPFKNTKIIYCSICKKVEYYDHDCSRYNKEFSTCLMTNCNLLFRSYNDFTPHYRKHIAIPTEAAMCRRCFKENKKSERDENGCHIKCYRANLFKCYLCKITFNNMPELAFHKFKNHSCQLVNFSGNYLCFFCETSSPDLMDINEHMKNNHFLED